MERTEVLERYTDMIIHVHLAIRNKYLLETIEAHVAK
jgi:hypothetical protein